MRIPLLPRLETSQEEMAEIVHRSLIVIALKQ